MRLLGDAMRLLRLQDVEVGPSDRVYRHSRMRTLVVWLAGFAATIALHLEALPTSWTEFRILSSQL